MARFRIGVVGLVHDHVWDVVPGFLSDARAQLVAVCDVNEPLLEKAKGTWGVSTTFTSYFEMYDAVKLDAVLVYTDNASAAEVVEAAAARGIHALVEKPMAATLEQADRMVKAARDAGTTLMVNWPTAWNPPLVLALEMALRGNIGDVFKVRYRASHQGPKEMGCSPYFYEWLYDKRRNGAGALMDYCCYGANYAAHLLGRPNAVTAVAGRFVKEDIALEDNAVILAKYHNGLAICEASWTQHGFGYELMINGSEGSLRSDRVTLQVADVASKQGRDIAVPDLPPDRRNAAAYFLTCLAEQRPAEGVCNPVTARNAQEILEAGILAAETGCTISLPVVRR